jgi:hypothetical protein
MYGVCLDTNPKKLNGKITFLRQMIKYEYEQSIHKNEDSANFINFHTSIVVMEENVKFFPKRCPLNNSCI